MVIVRVVHSLTPDNKPEYVIQWRDQFFGFGFESFDSLEELKEELKANEYNINDFHIEERIYGWQGNIRQFIKELSSEIEHLKTYTPCEHCGGFKYTSTGFRGAKNIEFKCDNCGKKLYVARSAIEQWL